MDDVPSLNQSMNSIDEFVLLLEDTNYQSKVTTLQHKSVKN